MLGIMQEIERRVREIRFERREENAVLPVQAISNGNGRSLVRARPSFVLQQHQQQRSLMMPTPTTKFLISFHHLC